jgi:hypothetical protein
MLRGIIGHLSTFLKDRYHQACYDYVRGRDSSSPHEVAGSRPRRECLATTSRGDDEVLQAIAWNQTQSGIGSKKTSKAFFDRRPGLCLTSEREAGTLLRQLSLGQRLRR